MRSTDSITVVPQFCFVKILQAIIILPSFQMKTKMKFFVFKLFYMKTKMKFLVLKLFFIEFNLKELTAFSTDDETQNLTLAFAVFMLKTL